LVYCLIIWSAAISVRSSEIFKLIKLFRELYVIIRVSVDDVKSFIVIYIYMIFSIAIITKTKYMYHPQAPEYDHRYDTEMFMIMQLTLGFGDSPADLLESEEGVQYGDWVVFILAMFIMNILILNTLIAILGDSHEKV